VPRHTSSNSSMAGVTIAITLWAATVIMILAVLVGVALVR
jgi:hypothetical protein